MEMDMTRSTLLQLDPLQRYTVPEASELLRQCRAKTYQDIQAGRIQIIKDGKRTYVPGSEIIRRSTIPVQTQQSA
jgi:Helix-turn-helix domain